MDRHAEIDGKSGGRQDMLPFRAAVLTCHIFPSMNVRTHLSSNQEWAPRHLLQLIQDGIPMAPSAKTTAMLLIGNTTGITPTPRAAMVILVGTTTIVWASRQQRPINGT